jgi:hypothetical protein
MNFSGNYSSLKMNSRFSSASEALAASNTVEKFHQKREILSSWQIQPIQQTEDKSAPDGLFRVANLKPTIEPTYVSMDCRWLYAQALCYLALTFTRH